MVGTAPTMATALSAREGCAGFGKADPERPAGLYIRPSLLSKKLSWDARFSITSRIGMNPFDRRSIPKYVRWSFRSSTGTTATTKPDFSIAVVYSLAGLTGYCGNDAAREGSPKKNRTIHVFHIYQ